MQADYDRNKLNKAIGGEQPSLYIEKISNKGIVEVIFSEIFNDVKNLTTIDETALELLIIPGEEEVVDTSKLGFTWNVTAFSKEKMKIELNFENAIYISSSSQKDKLQIRVLKENPFIAEKTQLRVPEDTYSIKKLSTQLPKGLAT